MRSGFDILCDWLFAQHVLPGFNCFFDNEWLNADRQGYNHSIDVFAGEEIIEGVTRCRRRVVVCLDGLSGAFDKFIGGCFGPRVNGFKGEDRGCLDGWEMLWVQDIRLVKAIMMPREGEYRP